LNNQTDDVAEDEDRGKVVAAVDLGSNSFHMIVARLEGGVMRVVDRHREMVRLADGLDARHMLSIDAQWRALACLRRFGQRLRELDSGSVRAVGTNTFRAADNASEFIGQAEQALGHPIDIISGVEEARLIYLGVASSMQGSDGRRLVVDIGGGSTELIIGDALVTQQMNSFYMGCVSLSQRYFPGGKITEKGMLDAEMAAKQELEPVEYLYRSAHWDEALGASGTIKAAASIALENGWCDVEKTITRQALKQVRNALLESGHVDTLKLKGLSDERKPVIPGGIAVLRAVFSVLNVETMRVSSGALREGLLYDLVGRMRHEDVREQSVQALANRCGVDEAQAGRVRNTALMLHGLVARSWKLGDEELEHMLGWSAVLHECGMMVAYNQYHKHGKYIIQNANLGGFSQQEQLLLAVLVRAHRRKFPVEDINALPERWKKQATRLAILLRIAVTLNRGRSDVQLPDFTVSVGKSKIGMNIPESWLDFHPLTRADLASEADYLAAIGYKLAFT
jgi:exopolyphosphatase/guanosine-5'-triphosphate,3'-diphosphate pyrophosphatase